MNDFGNALCPYCGKKLRVTAMYNCASCRKSLLALGTENIHALALSHSEILAGIERAWTAGSFGDEFARLCLIFKKRFGKDVTSGDVDVFRNKGKVPDANPI